ncbi:MAG: amino acid ABC transporter substrate-binding protein [Streptosporangiaceae bacterium]
MRSQPLVAAGCAALLAAAVGCGSKGSGGGAGGATSGDTLTLGASLSLTGSLAREGQLTKEGYQLCQDKVNAKGGVPVGGKKLKLKLKYQDDKSQPDTAAQIVDSYNDQGVKLILGPYSSSLTEAAAAVIERDGQVMVDSAGADNKIFDHGYKRTFAVLSPATKYAASMVKAVDDLAKPKPKTIGILSADDGFSKTVAQGAIATAKKRGLKVVAKEYFPEGSTDVSSSLTKIRGKKPDVVLGSVHVAEGIAIIKQASELGVRPMGFAESVAPPTPDFAKTLGKKANGVLGSSQWTPQVTGSDKYFGTAEDYAKAIKRKFGHRPDYHDAEASAGCLALVLAVEKAGSTDPGKVRDALAALNTDTFFGHVQFNDKGMNVYKPMEVIQVQDGEVTTVWPKKDAEAEMIWPATQE